MQALVDSLKLSGMIRMPAVEAAFRKTDRLDFMATSDPPSVQQLLHGERMTAADVAKISAACAYRDRPSALLRGATITAPGLHAHVTELLAHALAKPKARVLDVGSGSGYLLPIFAYMSPDHSSTVVGVEHIPEMVEFSKRAIGRHIAAVAAASSGPQSPPLTIGTDAGCRIHVVCGDGRLGYPPLAPYDAIHVGAAASEVPSALLESLAPGGRLVMPVGHASVQVYRVVDKSVDPHGNVSYQPFDDTSMQVVFVPLTDVSAYPSTP